MNFAVQECPDSQYNRFGSEFQSHPGHCTGNGIVFNDKIFNRLLENHQVRLVFQCGAHCQTVKHAVSLSTGGMNCRSFAGVQGSELNTGTVSGMCHQSAECIDLFNQMSLTNPTDSRVAGHLTQSVDIVSQ